MGKKRRGRIEFESLIESPPLVEGGNDFAKCLKMFLEELEIKNLSYHTRRWHRENLVAVEKALKSLSLPSEPINGTSKSIKDSVL